MDLAFVDDSKQANPTRDGMGPLVASGGFFLDADAAWQAELQIDELCDDSGFPAGEEFKWSPGNGTWMRDALIGEDRQAFLLRVVEILLAHDARCIFVCEDSTKGRALATSPAAEADVVAMLLERLENRLADGGTRAMLIADRPGGGTPNENRFLAECLDQLREGTQFVQHNRITFVVATQSRFIRLLQAADLVASCMTAYVAGESIYSPPIASALIPMFPESSGRRGGASVKIHPDYSYVNLYHWLLGDTNTGPAQGGEVLPKQNRPYATGPHEK